MSGNHRRKRRDFHVSRMSRAYKGLLFLLDKLKVLKPADYPWRKKYITQLKCVENYYEKLRKAQRIK